MKNFDHPAKTVTRSVNSNEGGPQTRSNPKSGSAPRTGEKLNPMNCSPKAA